MKISIICVGKIKEKYFRDAVAEYEKRLLEHFDSKIVYYNHYNEVFNNKK